MILKKLLFLILILTACQKDNETSSKDDTKYCGVESLGEWSEIEWLHTVSDLTGDYEHFGNGIGPSPIVPYPASDLKSASFSFDEDYVYVMFEFNGIIPEDTVSVDANGEELYIHSQGMNLAINFDNTETEGNTGSMWGIDTFFAIGIHYYSQCIEPYAPYQFDSTDIHSMTASIYGDSHPTMGGFGTNFVIARYPIELIKENFQYEEFQIFGWAEAEGFSEEEFEHFLKPRYHEFVHDDLETSYYKNKST